MQRIALKVQNALDEIASALERVRAVVCWADPNASSFFLIIATVAALLVPLLGLHTLISFLLCWMVRPRHSCCMGLSEMLTCLIVCFWVVDTARVSQSTAPSSLLNSIHVNYSLQLLVQVNLLTWNCVMNEFPCVLALD